MYSYIQFIEIKRAYFINENLNIYNNGKPPRKKFLLKINKLGIWRLQQAAYRSSIWDVDVIIIDTWDDLPPYSNHVAEGKQIELEESSSCTMNSWQQQKKNTLTISFPSLLPLIVFLLLCDSGTRFWFASQWASVVSSILNVLL